MGDAPSPEESARLPRLFGLATFALAFNVGVILWGALVRATGSGAGCGAHWPTCNGTVVPLDPSLGTLIEFAHRATSGLALLLVAFLFHRVFRYRAAGHLARFWAAAALVLILSEAAIGAGLVLFQRVAYDPSLARGVWISGHLINTFLLLAALTLTRRFVDEPLQIASASPALVLRSTFPLGSREGSIGAAAAVVLLTGITGAIAALGDTLFKVDTLREALAQDLSPTSHLFVRLRVLHPMIAILGGCLVLMVGYRVITGNPDDLSARKRGMRLAGLIAFQWFLGLTNLVLLAPTPLQIAHLLVADLIWITLVQVAASGERSS